MSRPDLFAEIAEVIGLPDAVRLAEARGGGRLKIPAHASANHWLVAFLGRDKTDRLCDHFRTLSPEGRPRGVEIDMPRGPSGTMAELRRRLGEAKQQMADAMDAGATAEEAARRSGLTRRTAYRMRRRGIDNKQLKMF